MIWVIMFTSAVAIAVFVERVLHFHRAQINSMEFLNGVRNVLKRDNVVEALSICDATGAGNFSFRKPRTVVTAVLAMSSEIPVLAETRLTNSSPLETASARPGMVCECAMQGRLAATEKRESPCHPCLSDRLCTFTVVRYES